MNPRSLTVVRHAHAENARPGKEDFDRALSVRGQSETAIAAAKFAASSPDPDLLLASPARRAHATAEAFAQALALDARAIEFDERLFLASSDILFAVLQSLDSSIRNVVLVGHNPGMSDFVRTLSSDPGAKDLSTAEYRSFACGVNEWQELAPGSGIPVDFPVDG